jgi:hypothetical protein
MLFLFLPQCQDGSFGSPLVKGFGPRLWKLDARRKESFLELRLQLGVKHDMARRTQHQYIIGDIVPAIQNMGFLPDDHKVTTHLTDAFRFLHAITPALIVAVSAAQRSASCRVRDDARRWNVHGQVDAVVRPIPRNQSRNKDTQLSAATPFVLFSAIAWAGGVTACPGVFLCPQRRCCGCPSCRCCFWIARGPLPWHVRKHLVVPANHRQDDRLQEIHELRFIHIETRPHLR